jgi:hypothetical protein
MADGAREVSVKELEGKYEMEGNVPAEGPSGYFGDTEGAAPAAKPPAESGQRRWPGRRGHGPR